MTWRDLRTATPIARLARLSAIAAVPVLLAGCGQIGTVHQTAVPAQVANAPVNELIGAPSTNGSKAPVVAGGDVGGAKGTPLVGNSHQPKLPANGTKTVHAKRLPARPVAQPGVIPGVLSATIRPLLTNPSGPLYVCPVQGPFRVGDDFGAPRFAGGYHPHAGNDIFAPLGTPIVAPFDGFAENAANTLGGNAVIVRGRYGYVYNAHLSAYGRLGRVHMGDIIGYVGNTGDARGGPTHDHFEWHPYDGGTINWIGPYGDRTIDSGTVPAVDPFPYLRVACVPGIAG